MNNFIKKNKVIIILIVFYFILFSIISCLRHYTFQTQTWDMAAFEQSFYNSLHGKFMYNNFENNSHFAIHFSPILILLIPFYALWQNAYSLLILQSLALALAALPLFLFVEKKINRNYALLISIIYLIYPSLHWVNLFDFHAVAFAIPFIFSFFYFFEINKKLPAIIFLILTAMVAEHMIVAVFFIGIYLLLSGHKKFGIVTASISLLYFILVAKLIMPAFGGGIVRLDRYEQFGSTSIEIIKNIITNPKLTFATVATQAKGLYLFKIFFPVLFLPLLAWPSIVMLVPGLMINLLTNFELQFKNYYQYDSILIPFILIGTVISLERMLPKLKSDKLLKISLIGFAVLALIWNSPLSPVNFPLAKFTDPRVKDFQKIITLIPDNASVAAYTNLVPHLTHREDIYMTGREPYLVDYVVIDGQDPFGFKSQDDLNKYLEIYKQTGEYEIILVNERYFIIKKRSEI